MALAGGREVWAGREATAHLWLAGWRVPQGEAAVASVVGGEAAWGEVAAAFAGGGRSSSGGALGPQPGTTMGVSGAGGWGATVLSLPFGQNVKEKGKTGKWDF